MEEKGLLFKLRMVVPTALVVALMVPPVHGLNFRDRFYSLINKGNRFYSKGENQKALDNYLMAGSVDSASIIPRFNAGDAYYRLGEFNEAIKEFSSVTSGRNDTTNSFAYYNIGNSFFKSGDLRSAAEAYKRSLLINPDDMDAKYNLELALRMLKGKECGGNQADQSNKQKEEKEDDKEKKGDQGGQDQSDFRKEQQFSQYQEFQPQEIDKQQLERVLAAIESSDREVQKELMKRKSSVKKVVGKDW